MRKLILFDFDGVLVRSNHCHLQNMRDTFDEQGVALDVSDAEIMKHFGKHYKIIIHELLDEEQRTPEVKKKLGERLREGFEDEGFLESCDKIDGLLEFLAGLKEKGYELGIASGNSHYVLERWVSDLGIRKCFGLLIGVDDVKEGKPHPEMILKAARYFKVPAAQIVYVGDARNDVLMAKSAGSVCAVVLSGVLSREDAEGLSVDMIADDVTKLDL